MDVPQKNLRLPRAVFKFSKRIFLNKSLMSSLGRSGKRNYIIKSWKMFSWVSDPCLAFTSFFQNVLIKRRNRLWTFEGLQSFSIFFAIYLWSKTRCWQYM